jgi:hypothetical protein
MNSGFFIGLYFIYLVSCLLIGATLFTIIKHRNNNKKSTAVWSLIVKIYNIILFISFGVSLMNFRMDTSTYICLPYVLIVIFGIITIRMKEVVSYYIFMLMFTTVFSSFLHVYYLANVNDIKDVKNVFDGNIAYFNIFTLQSGVSFCFLVFSHIGFFSENIRLIVKLKKIRVVENEEQNCPICLDELGNIEAVQTICNHKFHKQCIESHCEQTSQYNPLCPICRTQLSYEDKVCFC